MSVITTVITPREMDPAFVHQLLRSAPFQEEYYRYGSGIVADLWSTRWSAMKDIRLAVPSLEEQSFIATFLDQETAQIDAFIADQEELIGLLTERRAATISHAVTKGLDPTVPMKDSGIEWLGLVPQHWNLPRLAYLARCSSGLGIDLSSLEPSRSQAMPYPVYGGNGVVGYGPSQNIREGNIVIGRVGALCGNVHSILEPSWVSDNALRLTIDPLKLDQGFLRDVISARRLNDLADKTAQPLITGSLVMAQTIPVPPIDEQLSLVKFLGRETAELDATIADAREAITLSKERRAALISAAVTGKIDVREHGAVA